MHAACQFQFTSILNFDEQLEFDCRSIAEISQMKSFIFVVLFSSFLALSYAIDITKTQTLYWQMGQSCKNHQGSSGSSVTISSSSGDKMTITPYHWNNNQTMECKSISYSPEVVNNDQFSREIGEVLMPNVTQKNQIVLYNCTYESKEWETVFLLNGKGVILLVFNDGCQTALGVSAFYDYSKLNISGDSTNPNNCSSFVLSGKFSVNGFSQSDIQDNGVAEVYTEQLSTDFLSEDIHDLKMTCYFQGFGVYYTMFCSVPEEGRTSTQLMVFFFLDNEESFFYAVDQHHAVEDVCWQVSKLGNLFSVYSWLLLSLILLILN